MNTDSDTHVYGWMVTFSDLLMILLTFFIMLIAMSSLDQKSLHELSISLPWVMGRQDTLETQQVENLGEFIRRYEESKGKMMIQPGLVNTLFLTTGNTEEERAEGQRDLTSLVEIDDDMRGLVLSIQEDLFFETGLAKIKAEAQGFLDVIIEGVKTSHRDILIVAHGGEDSPLEVKGQADCTRSLSREVALASTFLKNGGIEPSRLFMGGCEPHKAFSKKSPTNTKAKGRRVEIILRHRED